MLFKILWHSCDYNDTIRTHTNKPPASVSYFLVFTGRAHPPPRPLSLRCNTQGRYRRLFSGFQLFLLKRWHNNAASASHVQETGIFQVFLQHICERLFQMFPEEKKNLNRSNTWKMRLTCEHSTGRMLYNGNHRAGPFPHRCAAGTGICWQLHRLIWPQTQWRGESEASNRQSRIFTLVRTDNQAMKSLTQA